MKLLLGLIVLPIKLAFMAVVLGLSLLVALGGLVLGLLPLGCGLLCILGAAFWLWMLLDAIRNNGLGGWSRVGWVAAVWFLPILGALCYFFFGRGARREPVIQAA